MKPPRFLIPLRAEVSPEEVRALRDAWHGANSTIALLDEAAQITMQRRKPVALIRRARTRGPRETRGGAHVYGTGA